MIEQTDRLQDFQQRLQARLNEEKTEQVHSRLGVVIGATHWLIDLSEAGEILPIPEVICDVPGTQPWFRGLTNLRGALFGVTDLAMFAGERPAPYGKDARLVAFNERLEVNAAILVNRMMGLQNMASMVADPDGVDTGWKGRCYMDAAGVEWRELHLSRLCADFRFLTVTH